MARPSLIDVVEVAYDVDAKEESWLKCLARTGEPLFDEGLGMFAFTYDATVPERMTMGGFVHTRKGAPFDPSTALAGIHANGPQYIRDTFRSLAAEGVRSTPGFTGSLAERMFDANGTGDLLVINGVDPSGRGICMGAFTAVRVRLSSVQRASYGRLASHLANAYRLRRRLAAEGVARRAPWGADAVLSPRGRVEHVESADARLQRSRSALHAAAVAVDRARGRLRNIDAESALGQWSGLVDGRWSLVDKFDSDGRRYVLARRNEPNVSGLQLLTERERAVAAYAALGRTNKLIAYDLGIAHSTVRVLLSRAFGKLGVRTREGLVELVQRSLGVAPAVDSAAAKPGRTSS
jgi:DNA-binding CsgD family transcriptional regulator